MVRTLAAAVHRSHGYAAYIMTQLSESLGYGVSKTLACPKIVGGFCIGCLVFSEAAYSISDVSNRAGDPHPLAFSGKSHKS